MGRYLLLWLLGIPIPYSGPDLALWRFTLAAPPVCETGAIFPATLTLLKTH
jgi:hypothetical protein